MSNPKISVIIPVYNVEKYLSECLDSIVNQTLKDIEIICINDASTDKSLQILKEYASNNDRIKIIDILFNRGVGYARKIALKEATGEYILFCDSDDKYLNNDVFLELYERAEEINVDLLIFDYYFITNKEEYIKYPVPNKDIFTYKDFEKFYNVHYAPWMKLYKKAFLYKYTDWYLPEENVTSGDTPFHFQVFIRAESMSYLNKPLYIHYRREDSLQTKKVTEKKLQEYCVLVQVINEFINRECDILEIKRDIIYFFFSSFYWRLNKYYLHQSILSYKTIEFIKNICENINKIIVDMDLYYYLHHSNLNYKKALIFYKISLKLPIDKLQEYFNKKYVKEQNKEIEILNDTIQKLHIQNNNFRVQNNNLCMKNNIQEQDIKRLQNSWSYRIGRLFTYPFSIPLEFYRFLRDYNFIKKSNLFDIEYYLTNNEDVKKAKIDPIKHYLKFGWKEGRNPSSEFDGNEYLNKRPDVRVAGICPLVHYLKFGRN